MTTYKILGVSLLIVIMSCNQNQNDTSKDVQTNSQQKMEIIKAQGVITKVSSKNFEDTYNTLVEIITNNPNLKIVAQLDHQANAASVDLELNPTRVIMFGNPKLGTPLMQNSQITGLDLPQKILIWQDDKGVVNVSYNDPGFLKLRHEINGKDDVLAIISKALDNLSKGATGV
ncbi:uncharacterized protein (DUF302 family) [Aquimarina sp. MAR_2010_214]|uniref:DUF302 domain-containing protein n=1 Tax=Aquimarina sp. MAR_2010_214 TaxID=1250026 RepID=UPI000C705F32|nr:DUF302 domain-containing protein [Aquimarina sp. MAR_2010_214]PKV49606.1 uncharacterized protein (DUF302 family) [Aquimarina sp. MAR_2010_214]